MFDPTTFTGFHTWLSIIALASGGVVIGGLFRGAEPAAWMNLFLVTALGTTLTGFLFPFGGFLPSHGVGVISAVALAAAAWGWWGRRSFDRPTRIAMVVAEYLIAFVAVAQAFLKLPFLDSQGVGFAVTQGLLLIAFIAIGWRVQRRTAWAAA
jgi:hypothetical protein